MSSEYSACNLGFSSSSEVSKEVSDKSSIGMTTSVRGRGRSGLILVLQCTKPVPPNSFTDFVDLRHHQASVHEHTMTSTGVRQDVRVLVPGFRAEFRQLLDSLQHETPAAFGRNVHQHHTLMGASGNGGIFVARCRIGQKTILMFPLLSMYRTRLL